MIATDAPRIDRPRARQWQPIVAYLTIALILIIVYWPTMLKQPAGSDDPLLEDAGEFQVALNVWGTVHGTGYPLYTIVGNSFVHAARWLGVDPAIAPSLFSLACGLIALAVGYTILLKLTDNMAIAAIAMLLFGLTRATWAYNVFPKTYSLSLIFYFALFAIAVWPPRNGQAIDARRRLWWLALIGGFAVAHHRLLAFVIPGLLIALLPELWRWFRSSASKWRGAINTFALCIPLAAIGFLPYLYLPLRALAHGVWVYGDPSTPIGFWREFTAVEANYLFTPPPDIGAWLAATRDTLAIILAQVTPIGLFIIAILAVWGVRHRYEARIAVLCALPLLIFVLIWPRAVVAQAVIQPIVGYLIIAAAIGLGKWLKTLKKRQLLIHRSIPAIGLLGAAGLFAWSFTDLSAISGATLGVQEIAIAARVPVASPASTAQPMFILPWGMRYSAVAFSHFVTGQTAELPIGDHNTNFSNSDHFTYFTDKDSLYTLPPAWWRSKMGAVTFSSPAADLIEVQRAASPTTQIGHPPPIFMDGLATPTGSLTCQTDAQGNRITLHVTWGVTQSPSKSYSVFVHLIGADPAKVLATADENVPVYGWYPTDQWLPNTLIADTYPLDRKPGAIAVQFGLYEQPQPGKFIDYGVTTLAIKDFPGCD